jgi:hypothetical protein
MLPIGDPIRVLCPISAVSPLYRRTDIVSQTYHVAKCQGTKSLRDSPLRGEPDREDGSRGQDRR